MSAPLSPTAVANRRMGGWVRGVACSHCRRHATRRCDYLIDALTVCGRLICKAHASQPPGTSDVDYCPEHRS